MHGHALFKQRRTRGDDRRLSEGGQRAAALNVRFLRPRCGTPSTIYWIVAIVPWALLALLPKIRPEIRRFNPALPRRFDRIQMLTHFVLLTSRIFIIWRIAQSQRRQRTRITDNLILFLSLFLFSLFLIIKFTLCTNKSY